MNGDAVNNQDWEPVVFRKPAKKIQQEQKKKGNAPKKLRHTSANSNSANVNVSKIEESNETKHDTVSHDMKMVIQRGRTSKGLTQKALANQCNMPVARIQQYENGSAIPNAQELQKLRRVLGIAIKAPKKKKPSD